MSIVVVRGGSNVPARSVTNRSVSEAGSEFLASKNIYLHSFLYGGLGGHEMQEREAQAKAWARNACSFILTQLSMLYLHKYQLVSVPVASGKGVSCEHARLIAMEGD